MMEVTQHHYGDILKVSLGHQQKNQIMKRKLLVQWAICAVAIIALVGVLSSAALGLTPGEELARVGPIDPRGNSWLWIKTRMEHLGLRNLFWRSSSIFVWVGGWPWLLAGL